jgi:D-alanyl-lipoteichoic acid acyltransferase DltB (MBOAT superfamily)
MLFNSYEFIFCYLPVVCIGFFWLARISQGLAALWLALVSLFFYGWWNPKLVLLLLASIGFNYAMGYSIGNTRTTDGSSKFSWILVSAVTANLLLLAYFKYTNFFITTTNLIAGTHWGAADIVLPLGISFFTFTQIAFLVDTHRGNAREYNFVHYLLFVTYFPHLIAGPVLHHKQMMPQFVHAATFKLNFDNVNIGLTIFTIGLFKKVILADQFSLYANPVFDVVAAGGEPKLIEAWIGPLAYALQLYFDFSGYSDMAVGLSRIFNVKLPLNFNSPYKATNVIEFWRRWHMTLSTFLRDYLYLPLGGNRKGNLRRYTNLMATMLLGGLWHGAGWNFLLWGGLHGAYLVVNHAWRRLLGSEVGSGRKISNAFSVFFTFCIVVIAWVPFRAITFESTLQMWTGMVGLNGVSLSPSFAPWLEPLFDNFIHFDGYTPLVGLPTLELLVWFPIGLGIIWGLPSTQQWLENTPSAWGAKTSKSSFEWWSSRVTGIVIGAALAFSILGMTRASQFLYFKF